MSFSFLFFQTLALLRRASFWPPSLVYISVMNTQTLHITFLHDVDLLWAAFHVLHQHLSFWLVGTQGLGFYSISTICQSGEYILELYINIQIGTIQLLIFNEKFSPLLGLEPGTPWYQADMLPIELSLLGWCSISYDREKNCQSFHLTAENDFGSILLCFYNDEMVLWVWISYWCHNN